MSGHRAAVRLSAVLAALALSSACGDGTTEPPPPPPPEPARPTTVTVSPATAELTALGATVQLSAEVRDQNRQVMSGSTVTWASGEASVATVDASGLVTAAGGGTAAITATAGSASGTAMVTVAQQVSAVAVAPAAEALVAGDTLRLAAAATDANGHPVAGAEFSWASSDSVVADVDSTGLVTALAPGIASVTATSGSATAAARLTVEAARVAVTPEVVVLAALGDTVRLAAAVLDRNGREVPGVAVSWTSGDSTVAAVDSTGLVTAAGAGETTVTATSGTVSASASVTVMQTASTVAISPARVTLLVGDTLRLTATATDANGHPVAGAEFSWASSDSAVASVDSFGLVRGVAEGVAAITAALGSAEETAEIVVLSDDPSDHHAALTAGLPERPFVNATVGGTEGSTKTVGTLRLGLNPDAFPVIVSEGDMPSVLVAGSRLGDGRVVAFSGTDFLSSEEPGLLGNASVDHLLANAVRWAASDSTAPLRVVADNQGIADALAAEGLDGVDVVGRGPGGFVRDWGANALRNADVAVVVVNHRWGARLVPHDVTSLREFTRRGGGLVIAGSALHWSWWIEGDHGPFTGDALLRDAGISWNEDSIEEIASATTSFDLRLMPHVVWGEYIGGGSLDAFQTALLPGLFNAALDLGRTEELDLALARLVRETPALPTSSTVPEARLAAEIAETLGPHEWPETHPWAAVFPGLPAEDARRVEGTVTVDASRSEFPANASRRERHLPLGFYAPPGVLVTVEIPASHATGALRLAVGELYDPLGDWGGWPGLPVWRRAPLLRREFAVTDRQTRVANAYGGSIALVVPADYEPSRVQVSVRGAIPMAVYTDGESSAAEWFADLDAGAPQAIIQKMGGIRLVISSENARGVDDPGEVAAFWDGFQRHHAELSGEPVPRGYESHWIFNPQVRWGYANADYLRISYPLHGEHWVLVPGTSQGRAWLAQLPSQGPTPHRVPPQTGYSPAAHGVDWWLFGHELGHQWQSEDWTGHGITEVGVNLFTMYTLNYYLFSGDDYNVYTEQETHGCAAPLDHAALANERWSTAGDCEKLALYRQLIAEFGWGAMKAVFHSYYDPAYPRSTYGGALDGFAIRFSAIAQRDLVAFFRHWEYPLSESAAATIRSFGHEEWLPPGW